MKKIWFLKALGMSLIIFAALFLVANQSLLAATTVTDTYIEFDGIDAPAEDAQHIQWEIKAAKPYDVVVYMLDDNGTKFTITFKTSDGTNQYSVPSSNTYIDYIGSDYFSNTPSTETFEGDLSNLLSTFSILGGTHVYTAGDPQAKIDKIRIYGDDFILYSLSLADNASFSLPVWTIDDSAFGNWSNVSDFKDDGGDLSDTANIDFNNSYLHVTKNIYDPWATNPTAGTGAYTPVAGGGGYAPTSGGGYAPTSGGGYAATTDPRYAQQYPGYGYTNPAYGQSAYGYTNPAYGQSAYGYTNPAYGQSGYGYTNPAYGQSAYGYNNPAYGQSAYGQQYPAYGQAAAYGQQYPAYGQAAAYGQQQYPAYGQTAAYGQQYPAYGQSAYGQQYPAYGQAAAYPAYYGQAAAYGQPPYAAYGANTAGLGLQAAALSGAAMFPPMGLPIPPAGINTGTGFDPFGFGLGLTGLGAFDPLSIAALANGAGGLGMMGLGMGLF